MSDNKIDVLAVMDSMIQRSGHVVVSDVVQARAAISELIEADREFDKASAAWMGESYEVDSYGVEGSDFIRCLDCDNESGAGILNKGVAHAEGCTVHQLEMAEMRRATAIACVAANTLS